MFKLKQHNVILEGETPKGRSIRLRPMTEDDWDILLKWNSDPEVFYYVEAANVTAHTLEVVQEIYRSTSQNAFCFIIELEGKPVGDCSLQKMNIKRILQKYPNLDCRRIGIMIGEKEYWGQGIGTEAIRLLTEFGFLKQGAGMIFGAGIPDYNPRSLRAFQKAGYKIVLKIEERPGSKANYIQDLALTRDEFLEKKEKNSQADA